MHLFDAFLPPRQAGRERPHHLHLVAALQESGVETIINAAGAVNVARVVAQGGIQDVHRAVFSSGAIAAVRAAMVVAQLTLVS